MLIETERLILRRIEVSDAALVLELLNDPAFIRFVADRGLRTEADAENYIAVKMLPSFEKFGFGFFVAELKDSGQPIGMCGLIKRDTLEDVDVGFSILRKFWGQGYASEAAAAVMKYGLSELRLPRVVGIVSPENKSSIAVLTKIGLRFEKEIVLPGSETTGSLYA